MARAAGYGCIRAAQLPGATPLRTPLIAGGGSMNITERKRTQERVLRSESLLRGMLDAVDEGILMVAPDGKILSLNRRFRELWQVPPALAESGSR